MGENGAGVTVTLREIYDKVENTYDVSKMTATGLAGAREDVAALRRDVQLMDKRLAAVEKDRQAHQAPDYLKRAGYALGLVAAGAASGWAAFKGTG